MALTALTSVAVLAPAAASNVNTQVTDAVTQANVKVLGTSPAMAMGTVYQSTAQSTGLMLNNSPTLVTHAQSLTGQGVQQIYSHNLNSAALVSTRQAKLRQDSQDKVFRKIDAMAQRLAECGDQCVLNLHIHVSPDQAAAVKDARDDSCDVGEFQLTGTDLPSTGSPTAGQLIATCIVARMETQTGVDVEGVAWVVEDAPGAAANTPLASVDMYVQRRP